MNGELLFAWIETDKDELRYGGLVVWEGVAFEKVKEGQYDWGLNNSKVKERSRFYVHMRRWP